MRQTQEALLKITFSLTFKRVLLLKAAWLSTLVSINSGHVEAQKIAFSGASNLWRLLSNSEKCTISYTFENSATHFLPSDLIRQISQGTSIYFHFN